jgi:hypothetical protein
MEAPILAGWFFWVAQMATNRSESRNGKGRSNMLSTTLKTAVFAPIPIASVSAATMVNDGFRLKVRNP